MRVRENNSTCSFFSGDYLDPENCCKPAAALRCRHAAIFRFGMGFPGNKPTSQYRFGMSMSELAILHCLRNISTSPCGLPTIQTRSGVLTGFRDAEMFTVTNH